ncbi:hypothetical protein PU629_18495 [Pullulanibacillus sp. KACC 23026]|uniref:hypothetical protein n=1 Tax=Pullulanibacillus sp. KACC 23026 TaxID=3028315 RepID=UPI0023AEA137|nr:hypothetical protein [Pullulanibacillus sp. KACC 23026]WEG12090.1 hypothetical protein PU629_18495 [Pullulanibacillus sp. KACC 23026]
MIDKKKGHLIFKISISTSQALHSIKKSLFLAKEAAAKQNVRCGTKVVKLSEF